MGFCPQCRFEYNPEVYECPDCGVAVVSHLPTEDQDAGHSVKGVKAGFRPLPPLSGPVFAEMVKGALEKSGITCYIMIEGIGGAFRISGTEGHGKRIEVFVPEDKYEESLVIQKGLVDEA